MTNIGPPATTPNPAVHNVPDADKPQPLTGAQGQAYGTAIIDGILATIALALAGVNIFGIQPFAFLKQWAQWLQQQASQALAGAQTAQATAQAATTVQAQQSVAKPGWLAGDATADAVFPVSQITGASAPTLNVTSTSSVIGFIYTPDHGRKASIIWLGQNTTGLTAFYINLYQVDTSTGTLSLLEASSDILSSVSDPLAFNYYDLNTPIDSSIGNVYAVELVVTGSGTYQVAGIVSALPANTNVYPQQSGAARTTGLPTAPSTLTPTYSSDTPWFGLGGFAFAGPLTTSYTTAGSHTYGIPNWLKWGDLIDVVSVGAGGGGQCSSYPIVGQGGSPGVWATQTLVYGVDIPIGTTTLTVDVGAGGAGGFSAGQYGGDGTDSTVSGTGFTTVTATGGRGGNSVGGNANGQSPGDTTYHGVTYTGGTFVGPSTPGNPPGCGGGGGAPYGAGAAGADGAVWLAAYQAGTSP